jgi:hypothetical protein
MLYFLRPIFEGRTGLSVRGRFTLACGPEASSRAGKRRPGWQTHYVLRMSAPCLCTAIVFTPSSSLNFSSMCIIGSWLVRSFLRVLRPGGCIFHLNEKGGFRNAVRKYFSGRADALGFTERAAASIRSRSQRWLWRFHSRWVRAIRARASGE